MLQMREICHIFTFFVCKSMGCSFADCSSTGSTLTYPDILQHNFTILHSNEVGFFAFKREQNYVQNDTKFIVICFVLPEIFYFKQKIDTISVTAPSYLTYLFINCDQIQISLPNFAFLTVKSPSVTQRSVSQENAYKKS